MDWFGFCSPQKDGCCPGICDPGRQVSLRLAPLLPGTVADRQGPRHGGDGARVRLETQPLPGSTKAFLRWFYMLV
jgi:hypothetical protein